PPRSTPRAPTPPPFPSTTPFRSLRQRLQHPGPPRLRRLRLPPGGRALHDPVLSRGRTALSGRSGTRGVRGAVRGEHVLQGEPVGDRKSTRLNSSHVKISYAVFCV